MTWYPLQPCDESFFSCAPFVYRYPVELDVSPERVWESLTSDEALAAWGLGLHSLRWTSPRPFGVGTSREVVMPAKLMAVRERFFLWEDGRRKAFYATQANRLLVRTFAEDYLVEATSGGSRFTWTIALEPTEKTGLLLKLAEPLNKLAFSAVPQRAKRYFAKNP